MSWLPITTPENIQGASNTLAGILDRTVRAARGAILAGGNTVSATDGTIPDQVRADVVAIARWKWLISFPAMRNMQTGERKQDASDAQARLDNIANGKPKVEAPTDPQAQTNLVQMPSTTARERDMEITDQDGL